LSAQFEPMPPFEERVTNPGTPRAISSERDTVALPRPIARVRTKRVSHKTIVVDFDGVIHAYTSGWKGATVIPDPPVDGALAWIRSAVERFHVAILSARSREKGGIEDMREWLVSAGMEEGVLTKL